MARECVRQSAFAGTVGTHQGVNFTLPNFHIHATKNGRFTDRDVQVRNPKKTGHDLAFPENARCERTDADNGPERND
jgi:hypothetical protein